MRINRILARSAVALGVALATMHSAFAELPADNGVGVAKLSFPPDAHRAYMVDVEFDNFVTGRVVVIDPDKKAMLGMVSTGFAAPSTLSRDKRHLYTADLFYSRGVRGTRTDVLTAYNTETLAPDWEVVIPSKRSEALTERYSLATSNDDRFVYIYNFTPSTSITVVNTAKKAVATEIAIPGCVLDYPVGKRGFASLCGDGSLQVVTLGEDGKEKTRTRTPFFNPDQEKLVERAAAVGDTYYFVTTTGTVRPVDFSGNEPKILPSWTLVDPANNKEGWAPGGWDLMTVAPKLNRLYVLMHSASEPMKWEDPTTDIWVYDLATHQKIGTLEAPTTPVWSITATTDDQPLLLGTNVDGGLEIFDLQTGKHTATMPKMTKTPTLVLTH